MKNKTLHNIKSTGFKTPKKYFESFNTSLFDKLKDNSYLNTTKSTGFKVPNEYFGSITNTFFNTTNKKKPKTIIFSFWKKTIYASAIAASLALIFNSIFNHSNTVTFNTLDTALIENYLIEENFTSYELSIQLNENYNASDFDINYNKITVENFLINNMDGEDIETLYNE